MSVRHTAGCPVSNLPTRWTLVRKRGRAAVGSSARVETTGGCGWALPQPAASRMRLRQNGFLTPQEASGRLTAGCGCEGTKTSRGRYSRNSPSCCCNLNHVLKCLICQVSCPRLSRYGRQRHRWSRSLRRHRGGNGAGGSRSQGRVEAVLSSPATEGGASPSRPDEGARLEPRAPCYRRGSPGRGDSAALRRPARTTVVGRGRRRPAVWRSPSPSRRKDSTCRPGQARQRR
jgi:hypothetical protein